MPRLPNDRISAKIACVHRSIPTLLLGVLGSAAAFAQAPPGPGPRASGIDHAVQAVLPSLVRVSVVYFDQQGGREVKGQLSGSGTIISASGFVVTNHHVAGRPRRIVCTLSTKEEIPADLVGTDPLSDIAVVRLRPATPRTFPAARFGDSSLLRRGQTVLAMGSPLALSQSVTQGIVSNPVMIMPGNETERLDGEDVGTIVRWIGHDAAIYPGNSGGPLVNLAGEVVGINEISFGLGGAIPSNLARPVVDAIIKNGRVQRSWTGIEVQPRIGDDEKTGALIAWVAERSPAAAAGVKTGDIITKINETAVNARYSEQLPEVNQVLLGLPVARTAQFTVRRAGSSMTLPVTPVERPAAMSLPAAFAEWGFAAANLTSFEAMEMARESTDGIRVISLRQNGPADQARPALRAGDLIVEVEGQPIRTVADLTTQTKQLLAKGTRTKTLVGFERNRERLLTVIEIGTVTSDEPPRDARKAWIPVSVQVLTPTLADRLGLKGRTGVRVTRLLDDKTPLQTGDVILAVDNEPVRATAVNDEDLFGAMIRSRYRVGGSVTLTISRQGKEQTIPVTLSQTRSQPREMKSYDDPVFEFRARDVAEVDQEDPRLKDALGTVLVESVMVRGWAALGRLAGGDLILAIDGRSVQNVDDLENRMKEIQTRRPASVVFEVKRGIRTMFIEIQPAWK
jgi:serine protease Do